MTRQQAVTKVAQALRRGELCPGCGQLEERCSCPWPERYEPEPCRMCRIPEPRLCDLCELY
jgi:hypothetical protein